MLDLFDLSFDSNASASSRAVSVTEGAIDKQRDAKQLLQNGNFTFTSGMAVGAPEVAVTRADAPVPARVALGKQHDEEQLNSSAGSAVEGDAAERVDAPVLAEVAQHTQHGDGKLVQTGNVTFEMESGAADVAAERADGSGFEVSLALDASLWGFDFGFISFDSDTGLEIKPQLKYGVEAFGVGGAIGIEDVRNGLEFLGEVKIEARGSTSGQSYDDLINNFRFDHEVPEFERIMNQFRSVFLDLTVQRKMDTIAGFAIKKLLAHNKRKNVARLEMDGILSASVGVQGKVALGWADEDGYHMYGWGFGVGRGAKVKVEIFSGLHWSGNKMKTIFSIGNFEAEIRIFWDKGAEKYFEPPESRTVQTASGILWHLWNQRYRIKVAQNRNNVALGEYLATHDWYSDDKRDGESTYAMVHKTRWKGCQFFLEHAPDLGAYEFRIVANQQGMPTGRYLASHHALDADKRNDNSYYLFFHDNVHKAAKWTLVQASQKGLFYIRLLSHNKHVWEGHVGGRKGWYMSARGPDARDSESHWLSVHRLHEYSTVWGFEAA